MAEEKNTEIKLLAPVVEAAEKHPRGRTDFYIEIALIFILGILTGIAIKTEAIKRITIGYDDYRFKVEKNGYSINKLQSELIKNQGEEPEISGESNP